MALDVVVMFKLQSQTGCCGIKPLIVQPTAIPTELQLTTYCHDKSQVNMKFVTKSAEMQVGDEIYKTPFAVSLLLMFSLHYGK